MTSSGVYVDNRKRAPLEETLFEKLTLFLRTPNYFVAPSVRFMELSDFYSEEQGPHLGWGDGCACPVNPRTWVQIPRACVTSGYNVASVSNPRLPARRWEVEAGEFLDTHRPTKKRCFQKETEGKDSPKLFPDNLCPHSCCDTLVPVCTDSSLSLSLSHAHNTHTEHRI